MEINVFYIKEVDNFKVNFQVVTSMNIEISDDKRIWDIDKIAQIQKHMNQNPIIFLGLNYITELNFNFKNGETVIYKCH